MKKIENNTNSSDNGFLEGVKQSLNIMFDNIKNNQGSYNLGSKDHYFFDIEKKEINKFSGDFLTIISEIKGDKNNMIYLNSVFAHHFLKTIDESFLEEKGIVNGEDFAQELIKGFVTINIFYNKLLTRLLSFDYSGVNYSLDDIDYSGIHYSLDDIAISAKKYLDYPEILTNYIVDTDDYDTAFQAPIYFSSFLLVLFLRGNIFGFKTNNMFNQFSLSKILFDIYNQYNLVSLYEIKKHLVSINQSNFINFIKNKKEDIYKINFNEKICEYSLVFFDIDFGNLIEESIKTDKTDYTDLNQPIKTKVIEFKKEVLFIDNFFNIVSNIKLCLLEELLDLIEESKKQNLLTMESVEVWIKYNYLSASNYNMGQYVRLISNNNISIYYSAFKANASLLKLSANISLSKEDLNNLALLRDSIHSTYPEKEKDNTYSSEDKKYKLIFSDKVLGLLYKI